MALTVGMVPWTTLRTPGGKPVKVISQASKQRLLKGLPARSRDARAASFWYESRPGMLPNDYREY
jgi:hypothetical protein